MWELDHKKGWAPKNWWFWTVVLEKTVQSPLDSKDIKPGNPKGNQPWIFIGKVDTEAVITWCEDQETHWKRSWFRERLKAKERGKLWETLEKGGDWSATVHRVAKSWTRFSDWITITGGNQFYLKRGIWLI